MKDLEVLQINLSSIMLLVGISFLAIVAMVVGLLLSLSLGGKNNKNVLHHKLDRELLLSL